MSKILVNSAGEKLIVRVIKQSSNKGITLLRNYYNSNDYDLSCCYTNCSDAKREAFDKIRQELRDVSGYDLRITTYNRYKFTCAYKFIENANSVWLIYHIKDYRYGIKIS